MKRGGSKKHQAEKKGEFKLSAEAEAAVRSIHEGLEATMTQFMANVSTMCRSFDAKLQAALPHNPKAHFFEDAEDSPPSSPLLKRPPRGEGEVSPLLGATTTSAAAAAAKSASTGPRDDFDFPTAPPALNLPPAESKQRLLVQLRMLKDEARVLIKTFDQIHDWIALNVPTMQEEDNQGVEIMGIVISNVADMTGVLRQVYGLEGKYLSDRVSIEAKGARYPDCPSYDRALLVLDSNMWDDVEKGWRSMIRACLLIHSVLAKNMTVLCEPRKKRDGNFMI